MHYVADTYDLDAFSERYWPDIYKVSLEEEIRRLFYLKLDKKLLLPTYRRLYASKYADPMEFIAALINIITIGTINGADLGFENVMDSLIEGVALPEIAVYACHLWPEIGSEKLLTQIQRSIICEYKEDAILHAAYIRGYTEIYPAFIMFIESISKQVSYAAINAIDDTLEKIYTCFLYKLDLPQARRNPPRIKIWYQVFRTIPVSHSLAAEQVIIPYEEARRIVMGQDSIAVAECHCRKQREMLGSGCDKPLEACLAFGPGALYYEENGLGRPIGQQEALAILDRAEKAGLVFQPSSTREVTNICACCGCCCEVLINLKKLPEPARHAFSNYFATIDRELCSGCGACLDRCQMDAIDMCEQCASILENRCIGCGLCVTTCREEAISLQQKLEAEKPTPFIDDNGHEDALSDRTWGISCRAVYNG